jgi:hypothetical protein
MVSSVPKTAGSRDLLDGLLGVGQELAGSLDAHAFHGACWSDTVSG